MLRADAMNTVAWPGVWRSARAILVGALAALLGSLGIWGLSRVAFDAPMWVGWISFVLAGFGAGVVAMKLSPTAPRRHATGLVAIILAVGWATDWALSADDPVGGWNEVACVIALGVATAILGATVQRRLRPSR